jgi:hypothetical protein
VPKPSFVVAIIGWIAEFEVLLGYGWKCVKKCLNCFRKIIITKLVKKVAN